MATGISEIHGLQCRECERRIEVWTSARNREVGATCCDQPMRHCWTTYPKAQLEAALNGFIPPSPKELLGWD